MPDRASGPAPLLDRFAPGAWPESFALSAAAVAVGLAAALCVHAFKAWIGCVSLGGGDLVAGLGLGALAAALLLPALGGVVVGVLRQRFVGEERHHGVAGIMESVALAGGRLRWRRAPVKGVAAGVSIGSGASVGPEDPSVQLGAAAGSMLGQVLRLSDDRTRSLVAAGAAAGVAAAFDAPIAGVFFAVEIVLGEIAGGALALVLLGAVSSAALTHVLAGHHVAFAIPPYAPPGAGGLPAFVALGALAGVVAAGYTRAIHGAQDLFALLRLPAWMKPALAGLAVGALALWLPGVLGVGYPTVEAVLGGAGPGLGLLLALLVAKLVATALCIGAGFPGGVFAPALFLGATLGGAAAAAATHLPGGEPAAVTLALVGMGAVLAGATHAPLTAILLLFELTRDYAVLLPAMLATVTSLAVSRRLCRDSVYTLALARKGIRLERGRDVEVLDALTVGETLRREVPTIPESAPAIEALERIQRTRQAGLVVVDAAGLLAGIVVARDLDAAAREGRLDGRTVGDLCTREVVTAYPDESLAVALRRMSTRDLERLPVVDREEPRRILGVLRSGDLVRAYDLALRRREVARHRAHQVRLGALASGTLVAEVFVEPGAACEGRRLAEAGWPPDAVLASIRRGSLTLVPRGDTRLLAGDVLVLVAGSEASRAACARLCEAARAGPGAP